MGTEDDTFRVLAQRPIEEAMAAYKAWSRDPDESFASLQEKLHKMGYKWTEFTNNMGFRP
jgi:hypothetical protein